MQPVRSTGGAELLVSHVLKMSHELCVSDRCLNHFLGDFGALWVAHSSGPNTSSVYSGGGPSSCSRCHNISTASPVSSDTVSLEVYERVVGNDDDHDEDGSIELVLDHNRGGRRGTFFLELLLDSKNKLTVHRINNSSSR